MKIRVSKFKSVLSAEPSIPYTVYYTKDFNLEDKVEDEEFEPYPGRKNAQLKIVTTDRQIGAFEESFNSICDKSLMQGWSACYSSVGHIGLPDAVAAYLYAQALISNKSCLWIDIADAFRKRWYSVQDASPYGDVELLILTGLKFDSSEARWSRAFDLLRSSSPFTSRVIVGAGATPLAIMHRLNLPVHRTLNLTLHETVTY